MKARRISLVLWTAVVIAVEVGMPSVLYAAVKEIQREEPGRVTMLSGAKGGRQTELPTIISPPRSDASHTQARKPSAPRSRKSSVISPMKSSRRGATDTP